MGLSSTTNRVSYAGDGSSTIFSFPYYFFAPADLQVYLYDTVASAVQAQTLNTHYTISGSVNLQGVYPTGGNVVMNSSFPAGLQIIIARAPTPQQNYVLLQNSQINSLALVQEFDYVTALVQRLQDEATRSLMLPDGLGTIGGNTFSQTLPATILLGSSANAPLVLNSSATGWTLGTVISSQSGAAAYFGTLPVPNGGTGAQSLTAHGLLLGQGSGVITAITGGATGTFLQSNGPSADPSWGTPNISGSSVTGILAPQFGGTGANGLALNGVLIGQGSSAVTTAIGASGVTQFLQATGPANLPGFVSIIGVPSGGTGSGSSLVNSRLIQSVGGTYGESALVINGSNAVSHGAGSLQNPGMNFLTATNNGLFYVASSAGQAYVAMVCSSVDVINAFAITSTQVNMGIGLPANNGVGVPLQCNRTLNGTVFYSFGNQSNGAVSGTVFQIANGPSSNNTTIENWANLTGTSYLAGASALFGNNNQTALLIGSEFSSGFIGLTVGGRALVNEKMRVNLTNVTLNKGTGLIFTGSTGAVTINAASSITSYNLVLPTGLGAANTFLQTDVNGQLSFATPANLAISASTIVTNTQAQTTNDILLCSGALTVTLYAPTGQSGKQLKVKKQDASSGAVTIVGSAATIDGSSIVIANQYEAVTLICDGTNWNVADRYWPKSAFRWVQGSGVVGGAYTTVSWKRSLLDTNSIVNGSTGIATVNRAGMWKIDTAMSHNDTGIVGDSMEIGIFINGAEQSTTQVVGSATGGNTMNLAISDTYLLNIGDQVTVRQFNQNTAPFITAGTSVSYFSGVYLGPLTN